MRSSHRFFIVVFLSVAILGLTGCKQEGTAEKAGKKVDQTAEKTEKKVEQTAGKVETKMKGAGEAIVEKTEKAGEYMEDSVITGKIKADILKDSLLKESQVAVTTTNGVVLLNGSVDSPQGVDRAMEIARSVKGVKSVENHLVVKGTK